MGKSYQGKKKTKAIEEKYGLKVTIYHAEGIDDPSKYPEVTKRQYKAMLWVQDDESYNYKTSKVMGMPDPEWKETFYLELDKYFMEDKYLHVQVIRSGSKTDPGTSTGTALVGRAKIPLPKQGVKKTGRFGLVRLHGDYFKGEGHIVLSMELIVKRKNPKPLWLSY